MNYSPYTAAMVKEAFYRDSMGLEDAAEMQVNNKRQSGMPKTL